MQPSNAISNYISSLGTKPFSTIPQVDNRLQREESFYKTKNTQYGNGGGFFGIPSFTSGIPGSQERHNDKAQDMPQSSPQQTTSVTRGQESTPLPTSVKEEDRRQSQTRKESVGSNSQGYTRRVNGRVSETVIEHPPIIRGVFERPSYIYTNVGQPQQQAAYATQGQPVTTGVNYYSSVSEKVFERGRDSQTAADQRDYKELSEREQRVSVGPEVRALSRLREQNEDLIAQIHRSEAIDKENVFLLKRNIENYHSRLTEMEEKYRRAIREKDELTLKLESKIDVIHSLRDKLEEVEQEARLLRGRVQKLETEKSTVLSENSELEAQVRRFTSEISSKGLANELTISELTNKLKASEDRTRHADRMVLDAEEEITRLTRELRDRGIHYQSSQDRMTSEKINLTSSKLVHLNEGSDAEGLSSLFESKLRKKILENTELRSKLEAYEANIRSLETKLQEEKDRSSRDKKDLQASIEQLEAEKRSLQIKLAELSRKLDESSNLLRDEKDRFDSISKLVDSLKEKIRQLEQALEENRSDKNKLIQEKKKFESLLEDSLLDIDRLKKGLDLKQSQTTKLEGDLSAKSDDLSAANRNIKDLENQIDDLKYQIKGIERKIAAQDTDNQSVEDTSQLHAEIERLQDLIRELSEQALAKEDELTAKNDELEALLKQLEEANEKLGDQLAEYEAKLEEYEQEIDHLSELSEKLACDNTTLQKKVDILTSQIEAALQSHEATDGESELNERLAYQLRRLINFVISINIRITKKTKKYSI